MTDPSLGAEFFTSKLPNISEIDGFGMIFFFSESDFGRTFPRPNHKAHVIVAWP